MYFVSQLENKPFDYVIFGSYMTDMPPNCPMVIVYIFASV